ncbi:MAG: hypothetical protein ACLR1T_10805 [Evtepia gabavorous]
MRKYLRKFRLYPGEIKMKKFCVLFVGIVILAIAGISAYGTEEKPVESELGSYYEEAVDQENSETDVVMAVYKEKR